MKIPRGRQDADVARMADFLRGIFRVIAPVVLQRFDQRRARRHGVFSDECVVGETYQVM